MEMSKGLFIPWPLPSTALNCTKSRPLGVGGGGGGGGSTNPSTTQRALREGEAGRSSGIFFHSEPTLLGKRKGRAVRAWCCRPQAYAVEGFWPTFTHPLARPATKAGGRVSSTSVFKGLKNGGFFTGTPEPGLKGSPQMSCILE